ncbi:MAG: bifunctional alpha,alpha-trehalose-phosphate synthase (UDP-forming)/trehalose-phosphatase [Acidobacteriota bacterium]|nr:bifunctional alpha,alpha-trehalose-phosphate synthase (UDP-forming)/trehalose-phosphatase [Acidobacteriota bacterium]
MEKERILIVSNRLPVTIGHEDNGQFFFRRSTGGLVAGLKNIHEESEMLWVGHCGVMRDDPSFSQLEKDLAAERLIAVPLDETEYSGYYHGISNDALWPLFHYFPDLMHFSEVDWEHYRNVNLAFAKVIIDNAGEGDKVWVHDYQLMLLPGILREKAPHLKLAYFHHIPFPSSEIFRIFPGRQDILKGLLGADYIGFHTLDYARHFFSAVTRILGCDIKIDEIHYGGRLIKVGAHPLGIDVEGIRARRDTITDPRDWLDVGDEDTLVYLGIDRLDYTKGIPQRLEAFERLLTSYPDMVGRTVLVLLCVPTRESIATYEELKAFVERMVGRINGKFARPGYTPVQYMYRGLPFEEVVKLYMCADVAMVTPLRDGLNLVAKEYVAVRKNDGVLILSEFAGAASELGEALVVNPFDTNAVAQSMYEAAAMEESEKSSRMSLMTKKVEENTNTQWCDAFLESWEDSMVREEASSLLLEGETLTDFIAHVSSARRVFLFLDNDGTMTPIASRPELAIPPESALNLLRAFGQVGRVTTTIVTGRPRSYCNEYFTNLPVNVVAEHGIFLWHRDRRDWEPLTDFESYSDLKPEIMKMLGMYTRFVPGSHIEEKESSMVWHYRKAEPSFAEAQAKLLFESLQQLLSNTSMSPFHGKKTVEVRQVVANKGHAVEHFLSLLGWKPGDCLITVGDDTTDEFMYRVHPEENNAVHIGAPNIYARYYMNGTEHLAEVLNHLLRELS